LRPSAQWKVSPSTTRAMTHGWRDWARSGAAAMTGIAAARMRACRSMNPIYDGPQLHVAITGATGLIGAALSAFLRDAGHQVTAISRRAPAPGRVQWDPAAGQMDSTALRDVDAVVHLAGETIAGGRWSRARKHRIRESRIQGTSLIARIAGGLDPKPRVLVSISAVGFYGDRGDEILTEASAGGAGFLADVVREWETAAEPARAAGIRVVHPRLAAIASRRGGLLERLYLPFSLGLGGPVAGGSQWMPIVALEDAVAAIMHAIASDDLSGPVNVSLPEPVTNRE